MLRFARRFFLLMSFNIWAAKTQVRRNRMSGQDNGAANVGIPITIYLVDCAAKHPLPCQPLGQRKKAGR
jgi:hypothetical protein